MCLVRCLQIINDLLDDQNVNLRVVEGQQSGPGGRLVVDGLTERQVSSVEEVLDLLDII